MKRAPLLIAALLVPAAAFAGMGFIGEGGGNKGSNPATDDYLVGNQAPPSNSASASSAAPQASAPSQAPSAPAASAAAGLPPAAGEAPLSAAPSTRPASPRIDAPNRPLAARPAAAGRNAPILADARPAGRRSLWNGLVRPLDMTRAEAAGSSDPDAARADSERDYETRILGMKGSPARPALGTATAAAAPVPTAAAAAPANGGKVFVSLEIDPREAGSLRDAVAGLGASVGFAADARFEAMPVAGGDVMFSGWMPAGRVGDALARPGVRQLRVETSARPSTSGETSGDFLVGLRVADAARARDDVDAGVRALNSAAGFRLARVVGLETAPDGRSVALIEGSLPLSRLSKAMGLPEVAKIAPLGGEVPAPAAASAAPTDAGPAGFVNFALRRGPWLIILTLLLLLPSLRGPMRRVAAVFTPYR